MTIRIHDASATAALKRLDATAGKSVDATELLKSIRTGISDPDGQAAGREWSDFHQWGHDHLSRLTPAARKVLAVYDQFAAAQRAKHSTGMTSGETNKMFGKMGQVAKAEHAAPPPAHSGSVGAARPGETPEHQLGRLNRFFKRQAYSPTWNPKGPSRSGNCAVCSLAMAAEAFGKEPPQFAAQGRNGVQPSIDWMAKEMGKHHLPGEPHNFGPTSTRQVEKGCNAVHLKHQHINPTAHDLSPIDQALKAGKMVVLTGEAGPAYRHAVGHDFAGAHAVLVMGRTHDGRYVVADPLSRHGNTALTAAQLKSFMSHRVSGGTAVWP